MKNIAKLLFFSILVLIITNCKKDDVIVDPPGEKPTKSLIDTLINNQDSQVQVSIPGKVTVQIPRGTVPNGTKLTVEEALVSNFPSDQLHTIHKVYEVKLSSRTNFNNDISITLNYDPTVLQKDYKKEFLGAAYYNSSFKAWSEFKSVTVDSINHNVTLKTNHLTPVGFWEFLSTSGYQHKMVSDHFQVYYTNQADHKVMDNTTYNSQAQSWHSNTGDLAYTPLYIQDLSHWLEEAYKKYEGYGLTVPTTKVTVYVRSLKGSDGEFASVLGNVYINNKLTPDIETPNQTIPELLKAAAAHEFLHYVQDYYYAFNIGGIGMWWLEATATQADRMVWGNTLNFYESENFSKKNSANYGNMLHYCISKSWDDCNSNPNWYIAGGFLNYLANYRDGKKANIASLIKLGGEFTNVSYYRTLLNDYIVNSLGGKGIGEEFFDYVQYLYERENTSFNLTWSSSFNPDSKTNIDGTLSIASPKKTISESLPHLSARIVKLRNNDSDAKEILIDLKTLPSDIKIFLYKYQNQKMVIESIPKEGDKLKIELLKKNFKDILLVNTSANDSKSIEIEIAFNTLTIEPEKIENGKQNQNYTFKAVYAGNLPDGAKYFWSASDTSVIFERANDSFDYSFKKPGSFKVKVVLKDKNSSELASAECSVIISAIDFLHKAPLVQFKLSGFMDVKVDGSNMNNYFEFAIDNNREGLLGTWSGNTFTAKAKIGGTASELFEYTVDYTVTLADDGITVKSYSATYKKIKWEMWDSQRYISQVIEGSFAGNSLHYIGSTSKAIVFGESGTKLQSNLSTASYSERNYDSNGKEVYSVILDKPDWSNIYYLTSMTVGFIVYP
ncbi:MAG: hypothetical protein M0P71_09070 [Melioribacteraceae bacterium]|nr:hypothetical protein [Melioribacteraceae bacterium]